MFASFFFISDMAELDGVVAIAWLPNTFEESKKWECKVLCMLVTQKVYTKLGVWLAKQDFVSEGEAAPYGVVLCNKTL